LLFYRDDTLFILAKMIVLAPLVECMMQKLQENNWLAAEYFEISGGKGKQMVSVHEGAAPCECFGYRFVKHFTLLICSDRSP
jgi:hypothetical protein